MDRLETHDSDLADRLLEASPQCVSEAIRICLVETSREFSAYDSFHSLMNGSDSFHSIDLAALEQRIEEEEDPYLTYSETTLDDPDAMEYRPEHDRSFKSACAGRAVLFAITGKASECIYESLHCLYDDHGFRAKIEAALSTTRPEQVGDGKPDPVSS